MFDLATFAVYNELSVVFVLLTKKTVLGKTELKDLTKE